MQAILVDDKYKLIPGNVDEPDVGATEIKIRVKAIGVNRADTLQKKGLYPPPTGVSDILGLEVAGEVCELGINSKRFQIGDRVFALLAGGGYAEYVAVDERLAMPLPENLEYGKGAGIAEAFLTAYQALFPLADLKKEETVLVHAGASGVGTAAIQLAKRMETDIIVTAGSKEKLDFCMDLGAKVGINYKFTPHFDEEIRTRGYDGVDVLIDFVGASYFDKNMSIMNPDGRWIILALMGGRKTNEINLGKILIKRLKIMGSTLRARSNEYKSELIAGFSESFLPLFGTGELKPVIDSTYPLEEVEKAHEHMESNRNIGKIILKV